MPQGSSQHGTSLPLHATYMKIRAEMHALCVAAADQSVAAALVPPHNIISPHATPVATKRGAAHSLLRGPLHAQGSISPGAAPSLAAGTACHLCSWQLQRRKRLLCPRWGTTPVSELTSASLLAAAARGHRLQAGGPAEPHRRPTAPWRPNFLPRSTGCGSDLVRARRRSRQSLCSSENGEKTGGLFFLLLTAFVLA